MDEMIKQEQERNWTVGVRINEGVKSYFFATDDETLKIGDKVVVENVHGLEIGTIAIAVKPKDQVHCEFELKPVIRRATEEDLAHYEANKALAVEALNFCQTQVEALHLEMNLLTAEYTLDRTKIVITYLANERIDFRELLKVLASHLRCRIELRQIGNRDKAKIIGGIGICGLELCCSRFLNDFDSISINLAKNQLLPVNPAKFTGQCGRLICCLRYENDIYTEVKKEFPKIGTMVTMQGVKYRVASINVLSRSVKLEAEENVVFTTLDELKKYWKANPNEKMPK